MATSQKSFEYTATGLLGDQRPAMLNNELHLRSELAKSKRHGYGSYPGDTYCYGMPYPPKDVGVAECLRWTAGTTCKSDHATQKSAIGKSTQRARPTTFSANMVFGVPVRPSTPINEILEFKFQDDWIKQQKQQQDSKKKQEEAKKIPPGVFRENRTSQLRRSQNCGVVEDRELWHMPKFSKSQPHLATFRTDAQREKAHKNQTTAVTAGC